MPRQIDPAGLDAAPHLDRHLDRHLGLKRVRNATGSAQIAANSARSATLAPISRHATPRAAIKAIFGIGTALARSPCMAPRIPLTMARAKALDGGGANRAICSPSSNTTAAV